MNPATEDLLQEREAARRAVEQFQPITKPWAFEAEPASTKPLLDFYLGAVKTCDLFVLVIGQCLTEPVKAEYRTARDYGKLVLAFRKEVSPRPPEVEEFLRSLDCKWDSLTAPAELREHLRTAIGMELLAQIRGDGYKSEGPGDRVAHLRRFAVDRTVVRVSPLIPVPEYDRFSVREVQSHMVVLEKKSSNQIVGVPLQRVAEILDQGSNEPPLVRIQGRLQWLTLKREWKFFPESPSEGDPLHLGVSKPMAPGKPVPDEIDQQIKAAGKSILRARCDMIVDRLAAKTHEVFYDDDGYYLRHNGPDTDSVLLIKK